VQKINREYSQTGLLETSLKVFIVTDNAAYGFHYTLTYYTIIRNTCSVSH